MTDKLLILRAFSTLNQVRDAKVPELNLLPGFHELVEDLRARLAQPEREWQGLTAKDLVEIPPSCYEGAIWADARLKEKNT